MEMTEDSVSQRFVEKRDWDKISGRHAVKASPTREDATAVTAAFAIFNFPVQWVLSPSK